MNKKLQFSLITILTSAASAFVFCLLFTKGQDKIAHFDFQKIYNENSLKKKLEKDLERVVSARKSELDSMNLQLSLLSNKIDSKAASTLEISDFETLKENFLSKQGAYEEENVRLKQEYFDQIKKHILEKARVYCESEGFDYLLSDGDETIIYASEAKDVTNEFQKFLGK